MKHLISDLHTHSTASDGQYTPKELVKLADQSNIDVIAITDHDTLEGLDEGVAVGEELGITVIRGIELSANGYPRFHILGYNVSSSGEDLNNICKEMKEARETRKYKIHEFLKEKGIDIPLSEVEVLAKGVVGKPHFARVMLNHGYVNNIQEAFDKYLDTPEYRQRIKRPKPSAMRCIEAIKAAGGKSSLAHPYQTGVDFNTLDNIVKELKGYGLDAIEICYPKYTQLLHEYYVYLTQKYNLHGTGGSDFHGEKIKPDTYLSHLQLDLDWLL